MTKQERKETHAFVGRLLLFPWLTSALIALLIWSWLVQIALGWPLELFLPAHEDLASSLRVQVLGHQLGWLDGSALRDGEGWRLLSSTMLHGSLLHLAGNCLVLFFLGRIVENAFGRAAFLVGWAASGAAGAALSVALNDKESLGASGAVLGMLGMVFAFGIRYRKRIPRPLHDFFRLDMGVFVLLVALLSLAPFVDWAGHLGGFVLGVVLGFVWPARIMSLPPGPALRVLGGTLAGTSLGAVLGTLLVVGLRITEIPRLLPDKELRALDIAVESGDLEAQRKVAETLLSRFPDDPRIQLQAAVSFLRAEQWAAAADALRRVEQDWPELWAEEPSLDNDLAWALLMGLPQDEAAVDEALVRVRRALKAEPDDHAIRNTLAWGLYLDGQHGRAERVLAELMAGRSTKQKQDDVFMHVLALLRLGRSEEALREFLRYEQECPEGLMREEARRELLGRGLLGEGD